MSNIILADEINRASAKTQSAMLEIMAERQVTVDGSTHVMERPFIVLATQNPIDSLGTYKLPEAQIDRFMIMLTLGYPDFEDELNVVLEGKRAKADISAAVDARQVTALIKQCGRVLADRLVASYIVRIVEATRTNADIKLGASPRGSIALFDLARAYALSRGRNYVLPDDIKTLAPHVLSHRIMLTSGAKTEKKRPADIIRTIVNQVVVPTGKQ
jgi:MoxR-like ATPase